MNIDNFKGALSYITLAVTVEVAPILLNMEPVVIALSHIFTLVIGILTTIHLVRKLFRPIK